MAQAIQAIECEGFDVILLTKTKIQPEAYSYNHLGYNVTCLTARPSSDGGAQGSVGLVTMDWPVAWAIDYTRYHMPNVVICKIVTGLN